MDNLSEQSQEMPMDSISVTPDMDINLQQSQNMESLQPLSIEDLEVEKLEGFESEAKPARFGKIIHSNYTSPDPEMDTSKNVITKTPIIAQSMKRDAGLSGNTRKSRKSIKSRKMKKTRRYHYVKQGKKCKKVIKQYKKLKCRGKRSKKCRPLQRKRKTCKKIIKHKRAMSRRSRKMK